MKNTMIYIGILVLSILFAFYLGVAIEYYSPTFDKLKISIGDIATVLSAIIMGVTAYFMYKANKISADSVLEMKSQREQIQNQYNDDIYRKDTDICKEYVLKITEDWDKFRETYNENNIANNIKVLLHNITQYIVQCLFKLSYRSVYREKLQELLQQTEFYIDNFANTDPKEIIDFVPKIIKILAKFQDYIKKDN